MKKISTLDELTSLAVEIGPKKISVAEPGEDDIFRALAEAARRGIVSGYLVGPKQKVLPLAEKHGLMQFDFEVIDAESGTESARTAVKLVREKQADFLMKGTLSTSIFLKAVLDKQIGLKRAGHLLSHVAIHEVPGFPRLLLLTDAAFNIKPFFQEKVKIIENAIKVAHVIGIERPKVACVAAIEKVNPKIQSTVDAAKLSELSREGKFPGAVVEGPFGFDNALDPHSAEIKGITGEVAGRADVIIAPDMDSGNMIYKTMTTLAGSIAASIVVGTAAPVILTSRADNERTKLVSLALGAVAAQ